MKIELVRINTGITGTNSKLLIDGKFVCFAIELKWHNNQRNISCIPNGEYTLKKYSSLRHPSTFEVVGIKNRSKILFHSANKASTELEGCIAPITSFTLNSGEGIGSKKAFTLWMEELGKLKDIEKIPFIVRSEIFELTKELI
jgi:hypothetical protein